MEPGSKAPARKMTFSKRFPFRIHRSPNNWPTMDSCAQGKHDTRSATQAGGTCGPNSLQIDTGLKTFHENKTKTLPPISPHISRFTTDGHAYGANVDARQSMALFLTTTNTVMSSAPTSPTSSDGETVGTPRLAPCGLSGRTGKKRPVHRYTTGTTTTTTKTMPATSTARWRRRAGGMMTQCSPFFNLHIRTNNLPADFASPYQSDVSQSAPSSPTIDTYETVPLIDPFTYGLDHVVVHDGRRWTGDKSGEPQMDLPEGSKWLVDRLTTQPVDTVDSQSASLVRLLERLGIQSVWPCLRDHNITELTGLSQLTRRDLIDMGVLDAETRATLMTAARLLTDSWLAPSLLSDQLHPRIPVRKTGDMPESSQEKRFADEQALHDSGCSSSNELGYSNVIKGSTGPVAECGGPMNEVPFNNGGLNPTVEESRTNQRNSGNVIDRQRENDRTAGGFKLPFKCSEKVMTLNRKSFGWPGYVDPTKLHVPNIPGGTANRRRNSPVLNMYYSPAKDTPISLESNSPSRVPVGILRNARASEDGNFLRRLEPGRRATSAAPKSVKIDERSLISTSKGLRNVDESSPAPADSQQTQFLFSTPSTSMIPGYSMQSTQMVSITPQTAVQRKLHEEDIDLTELPYSTELGQANIPLRLIQRYAYELNSDLITVAVALERERESRLREAGRPVISFMDDIHSRRFLNCDGIKTGTIEDFLVGIGLPMYIYRVQELRSDHKCNFNKPADLLCLSDQDLGQLIGLIPHHVAWLRREAAVIPSVVLSQFMQRRSSTEQHRHGARVNSLSRHSIKLQRQGSQVLHPEVGVTKPTTAAIPRCTPPDQHESTFVQDKF